ncbi:ArsR/SmtB family transcription factor [Nocardioides sp. NPDC087217]|uniref:ArsR/SmtB family transcription factor n=1 Tax=Nocardioides sp. NPDC087217 TaxID=3364335 RepID=UPI00380F3BE6
MSNDGERSTQFPVPDPSEIELVPVLKALADPVRLRIVARLADGNYHPCTVDEYGIAIHKSTLSHHFKTLREAGLTSTRVRGRDYAVRLRGGDLEERFPGLIASVVGVATQRETR